MNISKWEMSLPHCYCLERVMCEIPSFLPFSIFLSVTLKSVTVICYLVSLTLVKIVPYVSNCSNWCLCWETIDGRSCSIPLYFLFRKVSFSHFQNDDFFFVLNFVRKYYIFWIQILCWICDFQINCLVCCLFFPLP